MKRLGSVLTIAAVLSLAGGCHSVTYQSRAKTPATARVEQGHNFFFWGLSGEANVDIPRICGPKGAARINNQHTPLDAFLFIITLGIYAPRTTFVNCAV